MQICACCFSSDSCKAAWLNVCMLPCSPPALSRRRDAAVGWALSIPIFHPTTTLHLVAYAERGRGKAPAFVGKLHYRISSLLYLNKRCAARALHWCLHACLLCVACTRMHCTLRSRAHTNNAHACTLTFLC